MQRGAILHFFSHRGIAVDQLVHLCHANMWNVGHRLLLTGRRSPCTLHARSENQAGVCSVSEIA